MIKLLEEKRYFFKSIIFYLFENLLMIKIYEVICERDNFLSMRIKIKWVTKIWHFGFC